MTRERAKKVSMLPLKAADAVKKKSRKNVIMPEKELGEGID